MLRRPARPVACLAALVLVGCPSIDKAAIDRTELTGDVHSGLGRILEVSIDGADEATTADLMRAVRTEFEGRDLFDRIEPAAQDLGGRRRASRLALRLRSTEAGEVFDSWKISTGYVVRFDVEVALSDQAGETVLEGLVSGVAVDEVSDLDALPPERRDDMRVAALYDAASKLSRALRRAADARAKEARQAMQRITLPPGVGPVPIAVLGFDDEEMARRLRGPQLADHLGSALAGLGPDVAVLPRAEIERALDRDPRARNAVFDMTTDRLDSISRECTARLFVVGRVVTASGRARAEVRLLDRRGRVVKAHEASAEGLAALRVVAVDLAAAIGAALEADPPRDDAPPDLLPAGDDGEGDERR
ncbi:MAG: hypothetical protein M9894_11535 [Planctomycetes bacterium]|nr:hypothetical protein [Planctomycetota bacterium]